MMYRQMMLVLVFVGLATSLVAQSEFRSVGLQARIDSVQPMTGIVLWTDHPKVDTGAVALEYSYFPYDAVVKGKNEYNWSAVDALLDNVAGRGHQAILRFYFVYPGKPTTVPGFLKKLADYKETKGKSEGEATDFPDWSHPELKAFTLDFYSKFAKRYDSDPRLAFLQTGFGLWAEYHIYDGPRKLGKTFPDKPFQEAFVRHLDREFDDLPWMVSIDSADGDYSPFEDNPELTALRFGLFDDSFLCKPHPKENAMNWRFFGRDRWVHSPGGGEFSYYNKRDQRNALSSEGPNGRSFEDMAKEFHVTFMIGNDQPSYQKLERIKQASMAIGYRFRVTRFETSQRVARVTVRNDGIAPIYRDAHIAVNGALAEQSLKMLKPGDSITCEIALSEQIDAAPMLTIESEHLVDGQRISYAADLE